MKTRISTALAVVAFVASGAVFACDYAGVDDDAAAPAPADVAVSKKPVLVACEGAACTAKPAKTLAAPKRAKKPVVVACEGANCN